MFVSVLGIDSEERAKKSEKSEGRSGGERASEKGTEREREREVWEDRYVGCGTREHLPVATWIQSSNVREHQPIILCLGPRYVQHLLPTSESFAYKLDDK